MNDDPLLDYKEIAEMTGIGPSTLRGYRTQGRMPEPDELPTADRPRWRRSTIERWMIERPGQGARTDLRRPIRITIDHYRDAIHVQPGGDGPWEVGCRAVGAEPSIIMLGVRQMRAPADVAERLGVETGAPVIHRLRHMLADGVVCQIHAAWFPFSLVEGSRLAEPGIVTGGIYGELTRIGRPPVSISLDADSRMPTGPEMRDMQLPNRVPITLIERVTKDADGTALELLRIASASGRVKISFEDIPLTTMNG